MNTYKIEISREWVEYGELTVEAEDEDSARDLAREIIEDDGDQIQWGRMEVMSAQDSIDSVEQL